MKQNNKEQISVVRHVYEKFMGEGDLSAYEQFIAENAVGHCPASWQEIHPVDVHGRENTKKVDQEYAQAFRFFDMHIAEIMSLGDKVFVRWGCNGRHRGSFYGIKATNREFSVTGQTLFRFAIQGQIEEVWQSWDMLGLLRQIGWRPPASVLGGAAKGLDEVLNKAARLSERERDCLQLLLQGKTAKDTAGILFISPRTVEYYFENLKNKLDCTSKRELFATARLLEKHDFL